MSNGNDGKPPPLPPIILRRAAAPSGLSEPHFYQWHCDGYAYEYHLKSGTNQSFQYCVCLGIQHSLIEGVSLASVLG